MLIYPGQIQGKKYVGPGSRISFCNYSQWAVRGVVFVNAQSFTDMGSNRFEVISPGVGLGIRVKLNKFSGTNLALDYGWGTQGSQGIFVNLGKVF
jgi:hypothetical protein